MEYNSCQTWRLRPPPAVGPPNLYTCLFFPAPWGLQKWKLLDIPNNSIPEWTAWESLKRCVFTNIRDPSLLSSLGYSFLRNLFNLPPSYPKDFLSHTSPARAQTQRPVHTHLLGKKREEAASPHRAKAPGSCQHVRPRDVPLVAPTTHAN